MRRADFGTLLGPEFTLRDLPRITVRGQTVQGGSVPLRKAPLPSSVYPWSTKRPCGPLAFRRATEGSRVRRRVWGRQEGAREPYGALAPFCLRRQTAAMPGLPIGSRSRLQRRTAVSAEDFVSACGKAERALIASSGEPLYRRKVYPLLRVRRRGRRGLPDRRFLTLKKIFGVFSKKRLTLSLAYANLYTG